MLQKIYKALESQKYSVASKLLSDLLILNPDCLQLLSLKAMVYAYELKDNEAISLINSFSNRVLDPSAVKTVEFTLKLMRKESLICKVLLKTFEHNLDLDLGILVFQSCILQMDFKLAQQIATKLMKTNSDSKYLFWSIVCTFCDVSDEKDIRLQIIERLLQRALEEGKFLTSEHCYLYIDVLKLLKKDATFVIEQCKSLFMDIEYNLLMLQHSPSEEVANEVLKVYDDFLAWKYTKQESKTKGYYISQLQQGNLFLEFFDVYGDLPCFYSLVKNYLQKDLVSSICYQQPIQKFVNLCKMRKFVELKCPNIYETYLENKDYDDLLILHCHFILETINFENLQKVYNLTKFSKNPFVMVLLVEVLLQLGAYNMAKQVFDQLDIKNIQKDTMGHILTSSVCALGFFSKFKELASNMESIYISNQKETPQSLVLAFQNSCFSRIPEICNFYKKLEYSYSRKIIEIESWRWFRETKVELPFLFDNRDGGDHWKLGKFDTFFPDSMFKKYHNLANNLETWNSDNLVNLIHKLPLSERIANVGIAYTQVLEHFLHTTNQDLFLMFELKLKNYQEYLMNLNSEFKNDWIMANEECMNFLKKLK